ncbi:hypothetical protein E2C01_067227 [Portunus trituberculatus]|uniref:Uncharacterized protein n=1 Tax=Portunus trituberculatus TaxID=210409 RepID=A0A5B7HWX0_PORTR|nr:hypothetical protein [Portunus trituberculatus]
MIQRDRDEENNNDATDNEVKYDVLRWIMTMVRVRQRRDDDDGNDGAQHKPVHDMTQTGSISRH